MLCAVISTWQSMLSAVNRGAWITVHQGGAALCIMGCLDAFLTASGLASLLVTSTLPKLSLRPAFYQVYPRTHPTPLPQAHQNPAWGQGWLW